MTAAIAVIHLEVSETRRIRRLSLSRVSNPKHKHPTIVDRKEVAIWRL